MTASRPARTLVAVVLLAAAVVGLADLAIGPAAPSRSGAPDGDAESVAVARSSGAAPPAVLGDAAPADEGATLVGGDDVGPEAGATRRKASPAASPSRVTASIDGPAARPDGRPVEPFCGEPSVRARSPVARAALGGRIRTLLRNPHLKGAAVGLAVYSVTHGESLVRVDASTARIPASNAKLVTTATALVTLGPGFRFETRLVGDGEVDAGGVLAGDLVVLGDGDPDPRELDGPSLVERLAAAAKEAGLTKVEGRLVVDDRLFDREAVAPGWKENDLHKAYSAPVAGFSSYGNTLAVEVRPAAAVGGAAEVSLSPAGAPFELDASVTTAGPKGKHLIDVRPMPAPPGRITVRGKTPRGARPVPVEVSVIDPALVAGERLRAALRRMGVEVVGEVVLAPAELSPNLRSRAPVAVAASPLAPLLAVLNKESSNVVAEHLFKRCGYAHEGRGTFASGGRAARAAVERLGVEWGGSRAADGSGLSRDNRFSADLFVSLLDRLYRSAWRELLLDSLAVAGADGTLRRRLTEPRYRGRVRGKTGFVSRVSSVSGFAQTDDGEVIAFSILVNGFSGWSGHVKAVQDDVLRKLCDLAPR